MTDKSPTLLSPLQKILKSKRVMVALSSLILALLLSLFPELASIQEELKLLILTLALALIGGYSLHDAVQSSRKDPEQDQPQD
ncbi:hypothetical protein MASR2M15_27650 [Anaerolineales bacterium]